MYIMRNTYTEVNYYFPSIVKQSVQDGGFHEMSALSWKLGGGYPKRRFTSDILVSRKLSPPNFPNKTCVNLSHENTFFTSRVEVWWVSTSFSQPSHLFAQP